MRISGAVETERLALRTLEADHARGPYLDWLHDSDVVRYLEARFAHHDVRSIESFITTCNGSADTLLLGIFRKADGAHVGNVKLGPIDRNHGNGAIGILIGERDSRGKGYGPEAIEAMAGYGFAALGLHKLVAGCYAPNEASRRAFLRAGFHVEAVRRKHAKLDADWVDVIEMARFGEASMTSSSAKVGI